MAGVRQHPTSSARGFSISVLPSQDAEGRAWSSQRESPTREPDPRAKLWDFCKDGDAHTQQKVCGLQTELSPKGGVRVRMPLMPENAPRAADWISPPLFVAFLWPQNGPLLFGECAVTALGVFCFSCFLLSTAAKPCAARGSWCVQKALETRGAALNRLAGEEHLCSAVSPESRCVGEERLGAGCRRMTNPPELRCRAAVPKCRGPVQATAALEGAPLWRTRQEGAAAVQCFLPPLRATQSFTEVTGGNEQKINSPSTCPKH